MAANLTPATYLNIYSPADSPSWTLTPGTYAYEVYDIWGQSWTGTSGGGGTLTIPPPSGGWKLGSYRVFLPAQSWSSNFTVIDQSDGRFPPKPTTLTPYTGYSGGGAYLGTYDPAMRGVFGLGPERLAVANVGDPTAYNGANMLLNVAHAAQDWYHNPSYADPTHAREQLCSLGAELSPTPPFDYVILNNASGPGFGNQCFNVYVKNLSVNGATTFIGVSTGSSTGYKLTVYSPDSTTVVESYDNLATAAAGQSAVNAASNYIRIFNQGRGGNPGPIAPVAIGTSSRTAVSTLAGQFYAAGARWFEGPWNEPQGADVAQVAHEYAIWAASVKIGAPSAKTCGPGPVSYTSAYQGWITTFLSTVDRTNLDGVTVHAYNTHNGDVQLARRCMSDLQGILQAQGVAGLPLWQTEQGWQWPWYGVDRSRSAIAYYLLFLLMQEQYGIPLERNYVWYDVDDYFWLMSLVKAEFSGVLHPIVPAIRGLQAERHGKTYSGSLDFGTPGNDHYIGNVYTAANGSKSLALLNCGEGDGGQVQFTVTGAASLVRLDAFGNQTTLPVSGGTVTVAVDNTPTYLRVPAGVAVAPVKRDYGTNLLLGATVSPTGGSKAPASRITTAGLWSSFYAEGDYASGTGPSGHSPWQAASAALPQTVTITRPSAVTADLLVVRAGPLWQDVTTLLDFDVQVSPDDATWATIYTYTKNPTAGYVQRKGMESTSINFQSQAEQWDDERFLWVAPFTARSVKSVRLVIRAVTPGGALDPYTASAMYGNAGTPTSTYPTLSAVQLYNATAPVPPPASNPFVVRTIT